MFIFTTSSGAAPAAASTAATFCSARSVCGPEPVLEHAVGVDPVLTAHVHGARPSSHRALCERRAHEQTFRVQSFDRHSRTSYPPAPPSERVNSRLRPTTRRGSGARG